jgi:hypothetical protein
MSLKVTVTVILGICLLCSTVLAQESSSTSNRRTYSRADFVNVDGSSLADKIARAVNQFKGTKAGETVWLAYHFPARDGLTIGPFSGTIYRDDDGIRLERRDDPQGAAVFLLTDTSGARPVFTRVKTLSLNEPYLFENRPVYWLGNIDVGESMAQLDTIKRDNAEDKTVVRGVLRAISVHNSPRVVTVLKDVAQKDANVEVQRYAISSLSRVETKESVDALIELYDAVSVDAAKEEVIAGLARSSERRAADKLLAIARNDTNPKLRQAAVRRLSSSHGSRFSVNWN